MQRHFLGDASLTRGNTKNDSFASSMSNCTLTKGYKITDDITTRFEREKLFHISFTYYITSNFPNHWTYIHNQTFSLTCFPRSKSTPQSYLNNTHFLVIVCRCVYMLCFNPFHVHHLFRSVCFFVLFHFWSNKMCYSLNELPLIHSIWTRCVSHSSLARQIVHLS